MTWGKRYDRHGVERTTHSGAKKIDLYRPTAQSDRYVTVDQNFMPFYSLQDWVET